MQAQLVLLLTLSACSPDSGDTAPDDTAPDDTGSDPEPGDLLALMSAAEEIVWQGWPDALLVDVVGLNDTISGTTLPEDFGTWYLMFCANDGSGGSVEIEWTATDGFAEPYEHSEPYTGVRYEPIPRTLDLGGAFDLADDSGLSHPFTFVSVNTPESPVVDARYNLKHDGGWVFVDIGTGAVTEE